ncbi:MAG TPA: ATP-binding protein [Syntrophales bacterium]|nr:ATP-binding protein [Syntrophales bacterium]
MFYYNPILITSGTVFGGQVLDTPPRYSARKSDGSYMKFLNRLARTDVLVVDDWGLAPLTESERRDFLEVLDDRYGVCTILFKR